MTKSILRVDRVTRVRDASKTGRAALIGTVPGLLLTILLGVSPEGNGSGFAIPTRGQFMVASFAMAVIGGGIGVALGAWSERVEATPYRAPLSDYLTPTDSNLDRSERR